MQYGIDGRYMQDHFPGIGRYTYNLVRHLAPLAPQDTITVFYDPLASNTQFDLSRLREAPNIDLVPARASPFSWRQQWGLPRLARRRRLSLYHSPYYLFPYVMGCPTVVSLHDLIPLLHPETSSRRYQGQLFSLAAGLAVRRAERIVVDSEATRRAIAERWPGSAERIVAIPLAADEAFGQTELASVERVHRRLGLGQPYILHVGTNKPHKNLVRLVEAWANVPESQRAGHTLVFAGPHDPRYPELSWQVERRGLHHQVRFLGRVNSDDLPPLYAGAQAFVFPSLHEGFGLPILEAMASGIPVACSNRPSLPEVAGQAALFFDPGQVADIARALGRLLGEPELRARLARAGREQAALFSWSRTAAQTLRVYQCLLGCEDVV